MVVPMVFPGAEMIRGPQQPVETREFARELLRKSELINADWMSRRGLSESIPPAFSEFIGLRIMEHLGR